MKRYIIPEIELENIELEDVIALSNAGEGDVNYDDESSLWPKA